MKSGAASGLALFLLTASSFFAYSAEPFDPVATAKRISQLISAASLPSSEGGQVINDTTSKRGLKNLLQRLDPQHTLFLASDVADFTSRFEMKLDDSLLAGDLTAIREMVAVQIRRLEERIARETELLKTEPDFTVEEFLEVNPSTYAESEEAIRASVAKWVKFQWLKLKEEGVSNERIVELLRKKNEKLLKSSNKLLSDETRLFEIFSTALLHGLDPHSEYMAPLAAEQFLTEIHGSFDGIGISIVTRSEGIFVGEIQAGGPASEEGGLKVQDQILAVAQGEDGPFVDLRGMETSDVVRLIRGKASSKVRLRVSTPPSMMAREITLVRKVMELSQSRLVKKIFPVSGPGGTTRKVGYIQIPSFYGDPEKGTGLTQDVLEILPQFKGIDALILDVRSNGGGLLTEAVWLTGLFIDEGPVVQVQNRSHQTKLYQDGDPGKRWSEPVVVLTDKRSASASEIFAGNIAVYRRGIVVGDLSTHGKGTVQSVKDLSKASAGNIVGPPKSTGMLKLTTDQFFLPNGVSTQELGVSPHVVVPSVFGGLATGESTLEYHVKGRTIDGVRFKPEVGYWEDRYAEKLRASSAARTAHSTEFKKHLELRDKLAEIDARNVAPLSEEKYKIFSKEIDLEQTVQKIDFTDPTADAALNEALQITADYIDLLK